MPTQAHVNEIGEYLLSFHNGTRAHHQEGFHNSCGTAHCLAGWKALDDAMSKGTVVDDFERGNSDILNDWIGFSCDDFDSPDEWNYAVDAWKLTWEESRLLFEDYLTLKDMIEGLRYICEDHGLTFPPSLASLTL